MRLLNSCPFFWPNYPFFAKSENSVYCVEKKKGNKVKTKAKKREIGSKNREKIQKKNNSCAMCCVYLQITVQGIIFHPARVHIQT